MRVGRRQGLQGQQRGGTGRAAGIAALAIVASVVLIGGPPAAADRSRSRERSSRQPRGDTQPSASDATPARFVAEAGGRIAIVSADTGRVARLLTTDQPGGGAQDPTVSPDGRTVWFSRADGTCAAHLASVPVVGGDEQKIPGSGEAGPEGLPLPRPGRAQLAYSRSGCGHPRQALVVGDLRGIEGHGQVGLVPLAWNRTGDHLLAATPDGAEVHLLSVNPGGAITDDEDVAPADRAAECRLQVVGFSPDDNDGYVALRRCGGSGGHAPRRSLVLLDRNGRFRGAVLRLPRGQDFVDRPVFDSIGHSLLYTTAPADAASGTDRRGDQLSLWLWSDGESRVLGRQSHYRHPSWLP